MYIYDKKYDVIVIGAGHAGCESALAAARMGCKTLILTMNIDNIAMMSCNPAIGGLAKGHLVCEIDAIGGEMAKCIDRTGIQFRILNKTKGPAVQGSRAQADKLLYRTDMKSVLEREERLDIKQAIVDNILTDNEKVNGVATDTGIIYISKCVIVTTGTFLNGLIHIGLSSFPAGRAGEFPSINLSNSLKKLGFKLGRLKTGTSPRLDGKTINFSVMGIQKGDDPPTPFSYTTERITQIQLPCYLTYTNEKTHKVIRENLDRSPLYSGIIKGVGPRYCPSIEDKVVRFCNKERHQIFLEPEGRNTQEFYANGVSTSLPIDIQIKFLRTISGLEEVEIIKPGYAIEYDFVPPTQIFPTLETKLVKGLFLAGQINGTSGYEEAAAQGLMAGINSALMIQGKEPLILDRSDGYIGVLIDDLVTKGTEEPYRMFTSRAEYRLLLRQDNADMRLREKGFRIGLVSRDEYEKFLDKKNRIKGEIERLGKTSIRPSKVINERLGQIGEEIKTPISLADLLKRPGIKYKDIVGAGILPVPIEGNGNIDERIGNQVEIEIKYEGYIKRQLIHVERFKKWEDEKIPPSIDYDHIHGLSLEVREKLNRVRPISFGQASRISGITPSALSIIMIYIEKIRRKKGVRDERG
ncbi:MAG: tRNA uridine-5-carboxymethylaminomethyl(34) synthesis enzyme MnmG [Nitrospinae bacterium]|nr:tRNA uridine-5-carboxymethylaminomethyl(34) synthesis enzyme MnmG [Nitrospinota bacterium]